MASSLLTRKKTDVWLIGQPSPSLNQSRLPSIQQVLCVFWHYKLEMKKSIKKSATCTAEDVMSVWEKAGIPTKWKQHVIIKIEKYFTEWQKLKKNKENRAKRSETVIAREQSWKDGLSNLFDIAHTDAMKIMTNQEDRQFLINQRENRHGQIGSVDKASAKKEAQKKKKLSRIQQMQKQETTAMQALTEKCVLLSSTSTSDDNASLNTTSEDILNTSDSKRQPQTEKPPLRRGRKKLLTTDLAVSLDAAKLSHRKATIVLTKTLQSVGKDPSEYSVNYSSIQRQRSKHRKAVATDLKKEFKPEVPLTVHWDGKLIEDIAGHQTVDRLPILVSGQGVDQLLAVPKLDRGTGEACASAVYETVTSWNLEDNIKCLCFDTTAVNTGLRNGACIMLEQKMQKDMLWLACRHHIMEIMLEAVVSEALGPSSGPEILMFKRFKAAWPEIDPTKFNSALSSSQDNASHMIAFAQDQLNKFQPRDDYKELLDLTIVYLGGVPSKGISFKAPAGLHRARWMAKAIYCLKIMLFSRQFKLTKKEEANVQQVCAFVVTIYVKYWFSCPSACSAPKNDLQMLKDIKKYERVNKNVAKVALKKILGHLWYISEELVAFAFFDDQLNPEIRQRMASALQNDGLEHSPKRVTLSSTDINLISEKELDHFVTSNTMKFFEIMNIPSSFLQKSVELWSDDPEYKAAKDVVNSMRVINDIAERGVALIEEFNKLITVNEEQKQYLLLVVKDFRKKYPNAKKSTLVS